MSHCMWHNIIQNQTMFYGTNNIYWSISIFSSNDGIFCIIMSVPHNIVLDLNNVMDMCCTHGYPSTRIFMYFQILATYFWLDLYVLTYFFRTCKYPSPKYSKYFRSTKNLYVCERFLEQIHHILCTLVTMVVLCDNLKLEAFK